MSSDYQPSEASTLSIFHSSVAGLRAPAILATPTAPVSLMSDSAYSELASHISSQIGLADTSAEGLQDFEGRKYSPSMESEFKSM